MSSNPFTHQTNLNRINRVIDYVQQHLEQDLSLNTLASVAAFSPFHFHRIFSTITGETVHEFVMRKRIEKIANALLRDKTTPIQDLCLTYGFDNAVSFARAFKKYYGVSATALRNMAKGPFNKLIKAKSKSGPEAISIEAYIDKIDEVREWMEAHAQVELTALPALRLAYVRNRGSFEQVYEAFHTLRSQALQAGWLDGQEAKWLMVIHDNPAITEEIKMEQSACLLLDEDIRPEGEVSLMEIPKGRFLVGKFKLTGHQFKQAWDGMSIWVGWAEFFIAAGLFGKII